MKHLFLLLIASVAVVTAYAQTNNNYRYQNGYYKPSTGSYVTPHMKTTTNRTNVDNYSTRPNTNPWTGSNGTKARDYTPQAYNYGSGQTIQRGPRGGQYYQNSNGNKTYVPKRF